MKQKLILLACLACINLTVMAQMKYEKENPVGTYEIDLRPSPDAREYLQYFTISAISKSTFKGSFYGTEISNGLVNRNFEHMVLAFTTDDLSNTYYHFVKITDEGVEGLSYSIDRKLIQPWRGTKKDE